MDAGNGTLTLTALRAGLLSVRYSRISFFYTPLTPRGVVRNKVHAVQGAHIHMLMRAAHFVYTLAHSLEAHRTFIAHDKRD